MVQILTNWACKLLSIRLRGLALVPVIVLTITFTETAFAESTSILIPERTETASRFSTLLRASLTNELALVDDGLANTVLVANEIENPYNMTLNEAKNVGTGIGCSYLILLKADTVRRTSFSKPVYFESYAAVFLVDARSGELIDWHLESSEMNSHESSQEALMRSVSNTSARIKTRISDHKPSVLSVPVTDLSETKARPPMPFRRIRPVYTREASRYDIEATVDIVVEIDRTGAVSGTKVIRWAGYGLDQSVVETVKKMNWRPADIGNKKFAMQILLRYNFQDIEDKRN